MTLDNRMWYFLFRLTRSSGGEQAIVGCELEEITTEVDRASAAFMAWAQSEPHDDCVVVQWCIANGNRYVGSYARKMANPYDTATLDRLRQYMEPQMMRAIMLAVAAMNGEYGEAEQWTIIPRLDCEEGEGDGEESAAGD